jgi:hypothetical protein
MPNGQYEFVHNNYDNETRLKFEALKVSVSSTLTEFLSNVNIQPGRTSKKMSKNLNTFIKVVKDAPDLNTFKDYIRDIKILLDNFGINKTNKSFQKGMKFLHNYIDFTRLSDTVGADTMIGKAISTGAKVVQGAIGIYNNYLEKAKAEIDQAFQEVEELQKDLYNYSQNKTKEKNKNTVIKHSTLSFDDKNANLLLDKELAKLDELSELSVEPDVVIDYIADERKLENSQTAKTNDEFAPHPPAVKRSPLNSPRTISEPTQPNVNGSPRRKTPKTPPTSNRGVSLSDNEQSDKRPLAKVNKQANEKVNEQTNEKPLTKVNEQANEKPLTKTMPRPADLPKVNKQRPLPTKKTNLNLK